MKFTVSGKSQVKINQWLITSVYPVVVARQEADPEIAQWIIESNGVKYPYEGAIGGGLRYEFRPATGPCGYEGYAIYGNGQNEKAFDFTDIEDDASAAGEVPVVTFEITEEEQNRIREWLANEVYPSIVGSRSGSVAAPQGTLSYVFTPTSIGLATNVYWEMRSHIERKLDLTDYGSW